MLGSPNPGQSFGRGGAFQSGSNGGVEVTRGMLGATEIDLPVVILILGSLILARGKPCYNRAVCFSMFFCFEQKTIISNGKLILLGVLAGPKNNHYEW